MDRNLSAWNIFSMISMSYTEKVYGIILFLYASNQFQYHYD
jgi:hypothetical protein